MKASHTRTPRDMESAFGFGVSHFIHEKKPRPSRLSALVLAIIAVVVLTLVIFLMAAPGTAR